MLILWQLQDEFVELSYKNIYFLFDECWWDSVINDVLLCNLNGIFLGILVQKLLNMERYDFFGRYAEDGKKLPLKQWRVFHCHRHMGLAILCFLFFKLNFLNRFLVMNGFNMYPKHGFTLIRLGIYLACNVHILKYFNTDLKTWGKPERLLANFEHSAVIISYALIVVELLISINYNIGMHNIKDRHILPEVVVAWIAVFGGAFVLWLYLRFKKGHTEELPENIK